MAAKSGARAGWRSSLERPAAARLRSTAISEISPARPCHRRMSPRACREYWQPMATVSDRVRRARPLLGTFVEIEVAGAARSEMDAAVNAAFEAVANVHRLMSFHEADSDVSRLNREAWLRPTKVEAWTYEVLEAAAELHRRSNGVFDIAV